MDSMRSLLAVMILIGGVGLAGSGQAELVEGRDYVLLSHPQPIESGSDVEVLEFFWYGCGSCYALHPQLSAWLAGAPKGVSFRYVPAVLRPNWAPAAKAFYALEALGVRSALHDKVYDAIHIGKVDSTSDAALFDWAARQGIDRNKFIEAYNSFSVQAQQVPRSERMAAKYGISGVPTLVVDGKYMTSGRMGSTPANTIRILNELIDKARRERTGK